MGANSTQGWSVLLLILAFTFLSISCFDGGSVIFILLFFVTLGGSVMLSLKAKPLEHAD